MSRNDFAGALEMGAFALTSKRRYRQAAMLLGAAEAARRSAIPIHGVEFHRTVDALRLKLGQETLRREWDAGLAGLGRADT